jgi:hypothetical protein
MDDTDKQHAFISALVTEHFVLQTGADTTTAEMGSRAALYLSVLGSALVAMGFAAQSRAVFIPFVATVLPAVFVLGVFTVARLVDALVEYNRFLAGIARVRQQYRSLSPEAAAFFAPEYGRWPEASGEPALGLGDFVAFITTTASMVAFVNSVVAGAGVALLGRLLLGGQTSLAMAIGVLVAVLLMAAFLAYQRWRHEMGQAQQSRRLGNPSNHVSGSETPE